MDVMLASAVGVGFLLGIRHALDPDHVLAVSTILSERLGWRHCALLGGVWGFGHTLSLLAMGALVLILRVAIPPRLGPWLECGAGLMLVFLGANTLWNVLRGWRLHAHGHTHEGRYHVHLHAHRVGSPHSHGHKHLLERGVRPFLVGIVHGVAGSAGIAVVALAAAPSVSAGLVYMAALGVGSLAGMLALVGLVSVSLQLLSRRYRAVTRSFQVTAGAGAFLFGLWLLARIVHQGP